MTTSCSSNSSFFVGYSGRTLTSSTLACGVSSFIALSAFPQQHLCPWRTVRVLHQLASALFSFIVYLRDDFSTILSSMALAVGFLVLPGYSWVISCCGASLVALTSGRVACSSTMALYFWLSQCLSCRVVYWLSCCVSHFYVRFVQGFIKFLCLILILQFFCNMFSLDLNFHFHGSGNGLESSFLESFSKRFFDILESCFVAGSLLGGSSACKAG